MIRLAINAVTAYSGGGQTILLSYLRAWKALAAGLDITLYASEPRVIEAGRLARPDIRVEPFGVGLSLPRRLLRQQLALGPNIARRGADVVLSTNLMLERCGVSQIVHHQNLLLFEDRTLLRATRRGAKRLLQVIAARRALRRSSVNVFISDFMRRHVEQAFPGSRSRNVVIPNGLEDGAIPDAPAPSAWSGDPDLLAVTSEEPHKDNAMLIQTLAELVRRRAGTPWTLSLTSTGRLAAERRLAAELGVGERIRWLGFVGPDELDRLYRRALCLFHPSRWEGFGLPPLEAMARSCPVVAAACAAVPEVVGDAGLLVEARDPRRFAEAIESLLDNPGLRHELIAKGARRSAGFRMRDSARRFHELITGVAGRKARDGQAC